LNKAFCDSASFVKLVRHNNVLFTKGYQTMKTHALFAGLSLLMATQISYAIDLGQLKESVDTKKAGESVDTQQLKASVSSDGVDTKKAYDSVDKQKAKDSVDVNKARKALGY